MAVGFSNLLMLMLVLSKPTSSIISLVFGSFMK